MPPTILLWWPIALAALALAALVWIALAAIGVALEIAGRLLVWVGWTREGDVLADTGHRIWRARWTVTAPDPRRCWA